MDAQPDDPHPKPVHKDVAWAVQRMTEVEREFFEERAAILEFDAGLPIAKAEREALYLTQVYFGTRQRREHC